MKKYIVVLPIILFLIFWGIAYIPNGFTLMSEGNTPWYSPYTSIVFIFLTVLFYPATFIFELIGGKALGTGYFSLTLIYSIALSFFISKMSKFFKKIKIK